MSLHKKWSFSLRISSVNVTKSAGNCRFGQISAEILNEIQLKVFLEMSSPENSWENILKETLLMQISKFLQIFFNTCKTALLVAEDEKIKSRIVFNLHFKTKPEKNYF